MESHEIQALVSKLRAAGNTIGMCHGVFDLLHPGHISHFEFAKGLVDFLIVSVTDDNFVNKGPGRPYFKIRERVQFLNAIKSIDCVVVSRNPNAVEMIRDIMPDIYFKGPDYKNLEHDVTGQILHEKKMVEQFGGTVRFTEGFTSSSSRLINTAFTTFPPETILWLREFREKHSLNEIYKYLDAITQLKVTVIGEAIVDVYTQVSALGKTGKDPILAFQLGETKVFPGGSLAIANSISKLVAQTSLITCTRKDDEDTRALINDLSCESFIIETEAPTITKHRYFSGTTKQFETYDFDPIFMSNLNISDLLPKEAIQSADLVIVADYGHGFIEEAVAEKIRDSSKYLCVNVQANAGNRGINSLDKYKQFEFFTANSGELQIQSKLLNPNFDNIISEIIRSKKAKGAIMTEGERGLRVYSGQITHAPALGIKVVDKVGAGDTVFALASLLFKVEAPSEIIGFLTNFAAAQEVSIQGHHKPLNILDFKKHIAVLLA